MFDISFEINGRKVNPNRIGDALESAVVKNIQDSIKNKVRSTYCTEHNQRPKLVVKGRNLDNLNIEVSGCCDALIESVKKKIR